MQGASQSWPGFNRLALVTSHSYDDAWRRTERGEDRERRPRQGAELALVARPGGHSASTDTQSGMDVA